MAASPLAAASKWFLADIHYGFTTNKDFGGVVWSLFKEKIERRFDRYLFLFSAIIICRISGEQVAPLHLRADIF